jgi:homogentisate 1,2-dioxygenase
MSYYVRIGDVPPKRHVWHRGPDGQRLSEELMGEHGFSGPSSLLYHRHSPSAITAVEPVAIARSPLTPNDPVLPWHLRAPHVPAGGDLVAGRRVLLGNADVTLCWVDADHSSELYRNAIGDEVAYIHAGQVTLESVFGTVEAGPGDYVVIPRATTHGWVIPDGGTVQALIIEAAGHVSIPARYLTATGQLREGAPFSERDLRPPTEPLLVDEDGPISVLVRTRQGWSRHCHVRHPFDVVG